MGFEKVIGQDRIINFLSAAIKNDRLAHSYIFQGQEGVGKGLTAVEFSKAINCKNKGLGCGLCSSCVKIDRGNHPDIKIIEPSGSSIKNIQIEKFQNNIVLKPYESNKKVFIIKASDTMTVSAQNRLLKVLEEPPEYSIIILITQNAHGLIPTIRSRSQMIKFNKISKKLIKDYLMENYNIESSDASIFTGFSDGSLGKALSLYKSEEFRNRRDTVLNIIDEIIRGDTLKLLDYGDFFEKNKEYIWQILDFFTIWFRDLLLLAETKENTYLLNIDKIESLKEHLNIIPYGAIAKSIYIIEKARKNIDINVNFSLSIETMLLNLQEV